MSPKRTAVIAVIALATFGGFMAGQHGQPAPVAKATADPSWGIPYSTKVWVGCDPHNVAQSKALGYDMSDCAK